MEYVSHSVQEKGGSTEGFTNWAQHSSRCLSFHSNPTHLRTPHIMSPLLSYHPLYHITHAGLPRRFRGEASAPATSTLSRCTTLFLARAAIPQALTGEEPEQGSVAETASTSCVGGCSGLSPDCAGLSLSRRRGGGEGKDEDCLERTCFAHCTCGFSCLWHCPCFLFLFLRSKVLAGGRGGGQ